MTYLRNALCLLLVVIVPGIRGYFVTIEAHSEECFFDKVCNQRFFVLDS